MLVFIKLLWEFASKCAMSAAAETSVTPIPPGIVESTPTIIATTKMKQVAASVVLIPSIVKIKWNLSISKPLAISEMSTKVIAFFDLSVA